MRYSTVHPLRFLAVSSLTALLLLSGCSKEDSASSTADSSAAIFTSTEAVSTESSLIADLTDDELTQLISGKITLAQLEEQRKAAPSAPEGSTGSASSSESEKTDGAAVTTPGASSRPAYEAELQNLLQQLYDVKDRSESSLNDIIDSAKAEYKALPEEKQTSTRKVAIVMGKTSELKKLQSSCDQEVDDIIQQMRTLLTENGQSTALADEAQASYEAQKKDMVNMLTEKLYS